MWNRASPLITSSRYPRRNTDPNLFSASWARGIETNSMSGSVLRSYQTQMPDFCSSAVGGVIKSSLGSFISVYPQTFRDHSVDPPLADECVTFSVFLPLVADTVIFGEHVEQYPISNLNIPGVGANRDHGAGIVHSTVRIGADQPGLAVCRWRLFPFKEHQVSHWFHIFNFFHRLSCNLRFTVAHWLSPPSLSDQIFSAINRKTKKYNPVCVFFLFFNQRHRHIAVIRSLQDHLLILSAVPSILRLTSLALKNSFMSSNIIPAIISLALSYNCNSVNFISSSSPPSAPTL